MSYPHYTECVQPADHSPAPIAESVLLGAFGIIAGIIAGGVGAFLGIAPVVLLGAASAMLAFTEWWLKGRLVCLGGDKCAIGMVISVESPEEKKGFERFDSDYSFNLLLPPHPIGASYNTVSSDGFLGEELIKQQDATKNEGLGWQTNGYESSGPGCSDPKSAVLHCEIEGAGMDILRKWLIALVAVLSLATAASFLCFIPVIGWIACAIGVALTVASVIMIIAGLAHALSDAASPGDVAPSLGGSLHWGCNGQNADIVVVSGTWVYDSLHKGWNEIHPVKHLQRIAKWSGSWPWTAQDAVKQWCQAIDSAKSPLTQGNQQKPENQWTIHPEIDGCDPDEADFTIRVEPEVDVTTPGDVANFVVWINNVSSASPSSAQVSLTVESGLPAEAHPAFSPPIPMQPVATAKLNIDTDTDIKLDTPFDFIVRGTDTTTGATATTTARLLVIEGIK
ncbi:hypothetical protein BMS3Bbin14_01068 [bacterium BMS3Bbin14]|nr:hypothetical protein BMS3Abin13_01878 [bacterium BMS3Abin13]GBE52594.1 hypothetical protein BMS3Bbin14_01068 [bacterium BMS3Bbin14]HDO31433.1 hypothetical protein [Desulfobacteraceae bacterium]